MGLLQEKLAKYDLPQKFMAQGVYPYFREIEGKQGTEAVSYTHLKKILKNMEKKVSFCFVCYKPRR